jgi:hypothetical protein
MIDWKNAIKEYWLRTGDGSEIVFGPRAKLHELRNLEKTWNIELPLEFVSLYESTNGVFAKGSFDWWLFMPIASLPKEQELTEEWFPDRCREFARQHFRPFIRIYPDRIGYIIDRTGNRSSELWYFATADIVDGASCNPTEYDYLSVVGPDIEHFLRNCPRNY